MATKNSRFNIMKGEEDAKASSSKSSSKEFSLEEPPERNILEEGRQGLQLMQEAYPQLYELQNKWNPQFAALEGRTGAARSIAETEAVRASGTSIRDAIQAGSPEIAASSGAMLDQLGNLGPSAIETELTRQAQSELALGGRLSADETRQATQGARAAFTARGMGTGQTAAVAEVLNRAAASEARKAGRRQFAAGVDAQTSQRKASDQSYILNAGERAMAWYDPYQRIYGNGGSAVSGQVNGPNTFAPYLNAAGDAGKSNQDALLTALGMQEDARQFDINREDTATYTEQNREDTNRNAAAARRSATTTAAVSAAAMIARAFL